MKRKDDVMKTRKIIKTKERIEREGFHNKRDASRHGRVSLRGKDINKEKRISAKIEMEDVK